MVTMVPKKHSRAKSEEKTNTVRTIEFKRRTHCQIQDWHTYVYSVRHSYINDIDNTETLKRQLI